MTIDRTRSNKQQQQQQQQQQQPKKGKRVALPQTSSNIRLQDNQDKFNKMSLAERIAMKEVGKKKMYNGYIYIYRWVR